MVKESLTKQAYKEIEKYGDIASNDPNRLHYHIMPAVGLLNDPNGFVFFQGQYHIFYQWNPFATNHNTKFWGHYISDDLVHWEQAPIALAPDEWFDKDGCYSGSAIVKDGQLILFYTGNVKNEQGDRETYQCMATSNDGITFEKKGPVIHLPAGYTAHFRDPKVFDKNGRWYMVIGAQTIDEKGVVVLFSSIDLNKWTFLGPFAGNGQNELDEFGYMWECPDLFELNGEDILIVSPQGLLPQGYEFNNIYQAGYFNGTVDYINITYEHGKFTELDRGFDFYAPQTTVDDQGRRILFGWMGNAEGPNVSQPPTDQHWMHALTIPRQLTWKDGKLLQNPVKELEVLRENEVFYPNIQLNNQAIQLDQVNGSVFELIVKIKDLQANEFSIKIGENNVISYLQDDSTITFQRANFTDKSNIESRHCIVEDLQCLHIFKDTSSIEFFVNNGEEVFSSRVFDDLSDNWISFHTSGSVNLDVEKWNLKRVSK
jgi:beta-fructofuranosidase